MILNFIYGLMLAFAHFISNKVAKHKSYQVEFRSLSAGIALTYLLVHLLPELYTGVKVFERTLFLFILLGVISLHLVEKYLYQHKNRKNLLFELRTLHALSFFIYHIIIGIVLVEISTFSQIDGLLFFVPILFYTTISQVSLHQLHANITEKFFTRLILSASTLFGITLATIFSVPSKIYIPLLAFIAGALLYNVMVEVIPKEKDGNLVYFMLGTFGYLILIFSLGGF